MSDQSRGRTPSGEWLEAQKLKGIGRAYTHCRACRGALQSGQILGFGWAEGYRPKTSTDRAGAKRPPAWVDAETPFAASVDRTSQFSFLKSCYLTATPDLVYREMCSADRRYDDLLTFYRLLESEAWLGGWQGDSVLWVYVRPCPHCGDHDPAELGDLMLAESELMRALREADDRPFIAYGEDGRLISDIMAEREQREQEARAKEPQESSTQVLACPQCNNKVGPRDRFCKNCGGSLRSSSANSPTMEAELLQPPPAIARLERPPLLPCRACATPLTPRSVFQLDYRFRNTGLTLDTDHDLEYRILREEARAQGLPDPPSPSPPSQPPDPWAGKNWVPVGGQPEAAARAALASDPAWQRRGPGERELEVRRRAASHYLSTIPQRPGHWDGRIVRGLVKPCHACGEADPLGTAGPPSPPD